MFKITDVAPLQESPLPKDSWERHEHYSRGAKVVRHFKSGELIRVATHPADAQYRNQTNVVAMEDRHPETIARMRATSCLAKRTPFDRIALRNVGRGPSPCYRPQIGHR